MNLKKNNNGFTLVELMVVIAILGIISTLAIMQFISIGEETKLTVDIANVRSLNSVTITFQASMPETDPFLDSSKNASYLMNFLLENKFIKNIIVAESKDVRIAWDFGSTLWVLDSGDNFLMDGQVEIGGWSGILGRIDGTYTGDSKDIVIPYSLEGITVVDIYSDVFNGSGLTTLAFAEDSEIVRIFPRAFKNNSLTEVVLPDSLENISYGAFLNNDIRKVTIGSDVILQSDVFQNDNTFRDAYYIYGAGTYLYVDGAWVKE